MPIVLAVWDDPRRRPSLIEVDDTPKAIQEQVGGYFTELNTRVGFVLVNEEASGLWLNMEATKMVGFPIHGVMLVTGGADEEGNILDYTGPQGGGPG